VKPHDLLLLYTDGLCDLGEGKYMSADDPQLLALIQDCSDLAGEALLDEVAARVRKFSERDYFVDDVCLVGIEIARLGVPTGKLPVSSGI
jgi:serine phosphatase RsbU (regulator of sigma subunit)